MGRGYEMSVDTYVEQARTHVRAEREAVEAKLAAFEEVNRLVEAIPTESTAITSVTGPEQRANSANDARCLEVRRAFEEMVRSNSVDDVVDAESESLLATVRAAFTDPITLALVPTTDASFSPELRQTVIDETAARRGEPVAFDGEFAREAEHLPDASDAVDDVTGWIVDINETPLPALGFHALKDRHGTLATHRTRCGQRARQSQAFLEKATSTGVKAGVSHRQLPTYLYQDFPVDHPVLATVATLEATRRECQRTERDHLVRRV